MLAFLHVQISIKFFQINPNCDDYIVIPIQNSAGANWGEYGKIYPIPPHIPTNTRAISARITHQFEWDTWCMRAQPSPLCLHQTKCLLHICICFVFFDTFSAHRVCITSPCSREQACFFLPQKGTSRL